MRFYPLQAAQQVPGSSQRCPFRAYGGGDDVTEVTQLVAALDDERQGVVVVGGQLVTVQYHHLRASHLLLLDKETSSIRRPNVTDLIQQLGFTGRSGRFSHPSLCVQHLQISQQLLGLNHRGTHKRNGLLLVAEPLQHLLHLRGTHGQPLEREPTKKPQLT